MATLALTGNGGVTLTGIGTNTPVYGVSGATSVTSSTGTITLNGGTYYANAQTYTGPVTLGANTTLNSNNNPIVFTSTIDGAYTFTATAGSSTLNVSGAIGSNMALTALTLTGNSDVTLANIGTSGAAGVTPGTTTINSTATILLTGTTYNADAQTYNGNVSLTGTNPTITSNNNTVSFTRTLSGSTNLTVNAGTSTISLAAGSTINLGDVSTNTSLTLVTGSAQNFPNTVTLVGGLTLKTSTSAPQSVTFNNTTSIGGNISVAGLTTAAGAYAVSLLGGGTVTGTVSLKNTDNWTCMEFQAIR